MARGLSPFTRSSKNPILRPNLENTWEDFKVYNPGALYEDNVYHLFYRAGGKDWISSIGHATSTDGENFTRANTTPMLTPEFDYEKQGLEDPRIVKIDGTYFMTHTVFDGKNAWLALSTSKDMRQWTKHGTMLKNWSWTRHMSWWGFLRELVKERFNIQKDWSKAGALFPEKISGKYAMFFGDYHIWLSTSNDGTRWELPDEPFIKARKDFFDSAFLEMGPPPIKTERGWLVLYHGVDRKFVYRLGFVILDLGNPTKIIYRSPEPIFEPREPYELKGVVDILPGGYKKMEGMDAEELSAFIEKYEKKGKMPRVAFVNGAVLVGDTLRIYYGASDSVICTATAKLDDILALVP